MNYEEKYKEALENLRKIKEENKDNNELVEFIECKFPELKESKAEWVEKIRKELKDYLGKRSLKKLSESDAVNQWIYWIEKQSEQKPALSEDDERIRKDVISFVKQAINAGYGIIDKEREEKWIAWLEKQSKVNDYSLTMEDEKIREELFEHCINRVDGKQVCVDANDYRRWADWLFRIGKENIPNVKSDEVIKNEIIKFLELPHPQFVGKRHQEYLIEKQCEQKPTERSLPYEKNETVEGTFKEYADWMQNIGCATCIYVERLFSLWETKDKSKKFKFEFKCTHKNRIVTADDGQIGWRCRGFIE